ncbi:hypothetical protein BH10PSE14_BH10PSE14_23480 [soil metagenome]
MDSFAIEQGFSAASARVVAGQRALISQRSQVRELEQCGFDASLARALLRDYEQSQAMAVFDRNRFASALETSPVDGPSSAPSSMNDDDHVYFIDIDTYHRLAA